MKTVLLSEPPKPRTPPPNASVEVDLVYEGDGVQRRKFVELRFYDRGNQHQRTRIELQYAVALGLAICDVAKAGA